MADYGRLLEWIEQQNFSWSNLGINRADVKERLKRNRSYTPSSDINEEVGSIIARTGGSTVAFSRLNKNDIYRAVDNSPLEELIEEVEREERAAEQFRRQQLADEEQRRREAQERGLSKGTISALKGWETRRTTQAFRGVL